MAPSGSRSNKESQWPPLHHLWGPDMTFRPKQLTRRAGTQAVLAAVWACPSRNITASAPLSPTRCSDKLSGLCEISFQETRSPSEECPGFCLFFPPT